MYEKCKCMVSTTYIDSLYNSFYLERTYSDKSQILYTIIELKYDANLVGYRNSLYLDIKKFLFFYLESKKIKDYGYDELCIDKIIRIILFLPIEQQIRILLYTKSMLKKNYDEVEWIENIINSTKINLYKKNHNVIMWVLSYITHNLLRMCLSILLIILITGIFLLPAFIPNLSLYTIEYVDISSNFYINHFANIFALFFDIDIGVKINCLNLLSLSIYAIVKLLYFIIIGNFLFQKISAKISIYEEYT